MHSLGFIIRFGRGEDFEPCLTYQEMYRFFGKIEWVPLDDDAAVAIVQCDPWEDQELYITVKDPPLFVMGQISIAAIGMIFIGGFGTVFWGRIESWFNGR